MQVRPTEPARAITERLLAALDNGASENVALPYDAPCGSSPESSKVAKNPELVRRMELGVR